MEMAAEPPQSAPLEKLGNDAAAADLAGPADFFWCSFRV